MALLNLADDIDDVTSIDCHNYESMESCNTFFKNNAEYNFRIISVNIRSYQCNFDKLLIGLARFDIKFDAIILTECWLNDGTIIQSLPGFNFFRTASQQNKNGGIIIYIKSSYRTVSFEPGIADADSLMLHIAEKTAILGIYRSPSKPVSEPFINTLDSTLSKLKSKPVIIVAGDINIDLCDHFNNMVSDYLSLMASHGLLPAITHPTRIKTCLDHIFIKSTVKSTGLICKTSITDHDIVIAGVSRRCLKQSKNPPFKFKTDTDAVASEINSTDWSLVITETCVSAAAIVFHNTITEIIKKHTKKVMIGRKMVNIKPWITPGLIRCMRHRDKLHRDCRLYPHDTQRRNIYTRYRNFSNKLLRKIKAQYNREQLEKNQHDPKSLWKTIKSICFSSNRKHEACELFCNSSDVTKSLNECNQHFVSAGKSLANDILFKLNVTEESLIESYRPLSSTPHSLFLYPTDPHEVSKTFSHFKVDSAPGIDSISVKMIKKNISSLSLPLTHIFNLSFETGIFPDCWKLASISPIYKTGPKNVPNNYRPIALLSVISKLLEKLVNIRLINYLEKHKLISERQFGFRRGRSTEDAVTLLANLVSSYTDNGESCIGVFLDLAKAFDTVSVGLLLKKLESFGIRGVSHEWFKSYLLNRSQIIKWNDHSSDMLPISCGVPQGSILGPTLFILYINDILTAKVENAEIITYADDTAIIFHSEGWDRVFSVAEHGLAIVLKALNHNLLTLNASKTKYIAFSKTCVSSPPDGKVLQIHECSTFSTRQSVSCSCCSLSRTVFIKYLGVTVDENLSYKHHIADVAARTRKLIYVMKNLRDCTPLPLLRQIYVALCQSIIQYCVTVWGSAGSSYFLCVERAQRALIKVLLRKPFRFCTDTLYAEFKVMRVRQLFVHNATLRVHKSLKSRDDYEVIENRRAYRIPLPSANCLLARRSPNFSHPNTYNNVIKKCDIKTLSMFECKKMLTKWLLQLSYRDTEVLV